MSEGRNYFLC